MDVKMINTEKVSNTETINDLVPPETVIPRECSIGINISEIAITAKGLWINTRPDYIVFEFNENITCVPPNKTKCMFCKDIEAVISLSKMQHNITEQHAGYRYCLDCYRIYKYIN